MQDTLREYVQQSRSSDYFTGARLAEELGRFIAEQRAACFDLADGAGGIKHLFLVGSGGSYADMLGVKYLFDSLLPLPTEAVASYDLIWRQPQQLDSHALALFASLSGETEDTVAALRYAKGRGARTVGIVRSADSTIGREADVTIPFNSAACYEAPVTALALFGARLAGQYGGAAAGAEVLNSLEKLPELVRGAVAREEAVAEAKARSFLHSTHLYVIGAGPLSSLAYKVALTVVMENIRIGATYCDASEFRHGPAEALERLKPDMLFLLGTDESRPMTLRTLEFCRQHGARTLIYDAAECAPDLHPLLTGLVLNSLTQCFVVYSAILRGILDLDARAFMGHNVLATGGARWP